MKFSLVLVELPLVSFFLDLDDEFLGWFKCQANLAAGRRIHWRRRFLRVVRRKIDKLDVGYFFSGFSGLHHFVETQDRRVGALGVEEQFQCSRVFAFERGFVFVDKGFFLWGCASVKRNGSCGEQGRS